jgi:hypothetical protein
MSNKSIDKHCEDPPNLKILAQIGRIAHVLRLNTNIYTVATPQDSAEVELLEHNPTQIELRNIAPT